MSSPQILQRPSLIAQAEIPSKELDEQILQGQPAPFTGVLVYPDVYRSYQDMVDKYRYRMARDSDMLMCPEPPPEVGLEIFSESTVIKVGIGMLLGLIIGFSIRH